MTSNKQCTPIRVKKLGVRSRLQALVYDILPWRRVPESDVRSVGAGILQSNRVSLPSELRICVKV